MDNDEFDENEYHESEDEDFDPTAAAEANVSSDEDDEDDAAEPAVAVKSGAKRSSNNSNKKPKKKKGDEAEAEDIGFENSGDEAVVKRGTKRRRKHGGAAEVDEDSGGEGGYVKTRSMRATADEERARKPLATTAGATVDVNALWAAMNGPESSAASSRPAEHPSSSSGVGEDTAKPKEEKRLDAVNERVREDEMIEIEETYKFAGEVQVRKKLVPRSSAEAREWLESKKRSDEAKDAAESAALAKAKRHPDTGEPLLRPLRRISLWDPNPGGLVKGLPTNVLSDTTAGNRLRVVDKSKLGWHTEGTTRKAPKGPKATKVNVVEKSKMDWQAHVDATGDKEELEMAAKAKGSYLDRRDFLERVEARKDDEERRHRAK